MDSSEFDSSTSYDSSKKYRCPIDNCTAAFCRNSKLEFHLNKHTGERPFACDVLECLRTYTNPSHLRRHKATCHEKKPKVKCSFAGCSLEFYNSSNMKRHISRFHNKDRKYPYMCDSCDQGFSKKRLLQKHLYVHTGVKGFECDTCKLRFAINSDLTNHKRTHTTYTCEFCKETFERWSALLLHKKHSHKPDTTCDECGKKFTTTQTLHQHKKKVHALIENTELFSCTIKDCNNVYLYKKNLQAHIRKVHEKVQKKKIPCPIEYCGAMLSRMQCLKKHLNTHKSGVKCKKERATRKDTGIPQHGTASVLAGVRQPGHLNNSLGEGQVKSNHREETETSIKHKKKPIINLPTEPDDISVINRIKNICTTSTETQLTNATITLGESNDQIVELPTISDEFVEGPIIKEEPEEIEESINNTETNGIIETAWNSGIKEEPQETEEISSDMDTDGYVETANENTSYIDEIKQELEETEPIIRYMETDSHVETANEIIACNSEIKEEPEEIISNMETNSHTETANENTVCNNKVLQYQISNDASPNLIIIEYDTGMDLRPENFVKPK